MKIASKSMKILFTVISNVLFGISMITAAFVLVFFLMGKDLASFEVANYKCFSIVSGSMEPTLKVGAVVLVESVGMDEVQEGDIITYTSVIEGQSFYVTHRVIKIDEDGLVTLGDANPTIDREKVTEQNFVGRVVRVSKFLSFASSFVRSKGGFIALVHVPMILFLAYEVFKLIGNIFEIKDKAHEKKVINAYMRKTLKQYDYQDINMVFTDNIFVYQIDEGNGGLIENGFSKDFVKAKRQKHIDESKKIVYSRSKVDKLISETSNYAKQ